MVINNDLIISRLRVLKTEMKRTSVGFVFNNIFSCYFNVHDFFHCKNCFFR